MSARPTVPIVVKDQPTLQFHCRTFEQEYQVQAGSVAYLIHLILPATLLAKVRRQISHTS